MNSPRSIALSLASLVFAALLCVAASPAHAQMASQLYGDAVQAYNAGDIAGAKRKLQLTLEVDKNFRPASVLLNRIAMAEQQAKGAADGTAGAPLPLKALERITFPVDFKDTSVQSALEFIRQQTETASGGKTQINFVLQLPPELANKKISLQLGHVPVMEMLRYIGDLAGIAFQMQKYAVLVVPAGSAATGSASPSAAASRP